MTAAAVPIRNLQQSGESVILGAPFSKYPMQLHREDTKMENSPFLYRAMATLSTSRADFRHTYLFAMLEEILRPLTQVKILCTNTLLQVTMY